VLTQAIERDYLKKENHRLTEQLKAYASYLDYQAHSAFDFGAIVGESTALKDILARVEKVAATTTTVLLRGETGTGKEMVARAIHINSDRGHQPFVAVNCAALPTELLESELFGHEKGSFTGAIAQRKGRFELAHGGTIFLDEIGDLPMEVQVKLLRVLQEREFERVGGNTTIKVDVRVISASNRSLEALVEQGRFRQDLYYRINVFPLDLPPLRQRGKDILLLAEHFLEKFRQLNRRGPTQIAPDAKAALLSHSWPGNVREVQNVLERSSIVACSDTISAEDLDFGRHSPPSSSAAAFAPPPMATPAPGDHSLRSRLAEEEKTSIIRAIEGSGGNIAAAARALGINRSTLYFRIKKHALTHLLTTRVIEEGEREEPSGS
jgi:transcriptional regulator with GAF, ATPase, and Fis domain